MASIYEVFFRREQAPALHLHGKQSIRLSTVCK